jgi:hypothetical protein
MTKYITKTESICLPLKPSLKHPHKYITANQEALKNLLDMMILVSILIHKKSLTSPDATNQRPKERLTMIVPMTWVQ